MEEDFFTKSLKLEKTFARTEIKMPHMRRSVSQPFKMIASLSDDVKPLALSLSSFFHWSNRRGRKRTHTPVGKG